jgi:hypothetical protein
MTKQEVIQRLLNIQEQNINGLSIPLDEVIHIVKNIEGGIENEGEIILEWLKSNLKDIVNRVRDEVMSEVENKTNDCIGDDHEISITSGNQIQIDSVDIDHPELYNEVKNATKNLSKDILDEYEEKLQQEPMTV